MNFKKYLHARYLDKRKGPDNCRDNHTYTKYIITQIRGHA